MTTRYFLLFCLLLSFSPAYSSYESSSFLVRGGSSLSEEGEQPIYSKNPEANALYIQGLEYLSKSDPRAGGSVQNAKKALTLFEQAAEKDPQFALAYIGQADASSVSSFSVSGSLAPREVYRQQEAAALKAIELDDKLPQAHAMLAEIYFDNEYDWPKAGKELKRVIALTPNSVVAHTRYGLYFGGDGKV